jgi:hypothetical protein
MSVQQRSAALEAVFVDLTKTNNGGRLCWLAATNALVRKVPIERDPGSPRLGYEKYDVIVAGLNYLKQFKLLALKLLEVKDGYTWGRLIKDAAYQA